MGMVWLLVLGLMMMLLLLLVMEVFAVHNRGVEVGWRWELLLVLVERVGSHDFGRMR